MFRPAVRIASSSTLVRATPRPHILRRFASTAPPHQKSRSWKSSAARWGLAGALIYYYNTSTVFAEEPAYAVNAPSETLKENEEYSTVASISEQRRAAQAREKPLAPPTEVKSTTVAVPDGEAVAPGSPEALEEEASQEGAFNEETGEINWDCPCLGGMAYGPCGEQFRAAFSCFVFSESEPKGVDCIEHFKTMQNCFREHPDIYGAELDDDDEQDGIPPERMEGDASSIPSEAGAPEAEAPLASQTPSAGLQSGLENSSAASPDASSPEPVPRIGKEDVQSTTQSGNITTSDSTKA